MSETNNVLSMYEKQKEKIEKEYTKNGKLTRKGVMELFALDSRYGKGKDWFPEGYGTYEYERDH